MAKKTATKTDTASVAQLPIPTKLPEPDPDKTFLLNPEFEIERDEPKERHSHRLTSRPHRIAALLTILFAILCTFWAYTEITDAYRRGAALDKAAIPARALVIAGRVQQTGRSTLDRYFVTYQFSVPQSGGGTKGYQREVEVSRAQYERLSATPELLIKFVPTDPTHSTVFERSFIAIDYEIYGMIALIPWILALTTVIWSIWRTYRNFRYSRHGRVIQGEITSVLGKDLSGNFVVKIEYRFPTPDGSMRRGKYQRTREDLRDKPLPKPGDPVAVFFVHDHQFRLL